MEFTANVEARVGSNWAADVGAADRLLIALEPAVIGPAVSQRQDASTMGATFGVSAQDAREAADVAAQRFIAALSEAGITGDVRLVELQVEEYREEAAALG